MTVSSYAETSTWAVSCPAASEAGIVVHLNQQFANLWLRALGIAVPLRRIGANSSWYAGEWLPNQWFQAGVKPELSTVRRPYNGDVDFSFVGRKNLRKTFLAAMVVTFALATPAVAFAEPVQANVSRATAVSAPIPGYWVSAGYWNTEEDCIYQATKEYTAHPEYTAHAC
jgi:hypothetical protein